MSEESVWSILTREMRKAKKKNVKMNCHVTVKDLLQYIHFCSTVLCWDLSSCIDEESRSIVCVAAWTLLSSHSNVHQPTFHLRLSITVGNPPACFAIRMPPVATDEWLNCGKTGTDSA